MEMELWMFSGKITENHGKAISLWRHFRPRKSYFSLPWHQENYIFSPHTSLHQMNAPQCPVTKEQPQPTKTEGDQVGQGKAHDTTEDAKARP